jgi:DNA-binding response OmpR family regulator
MTTVLFIEDNEEIRENMGEILELANYKVLLAPDGKQGVALALSAKPDIIICDIMMPELDGYGVIHLLQKNEATRNIPFIFLTAKAERAELRKGMELGADDYITKPFSGTELLNAIEGRLRKAASQKDAQPADFKTPSAIVSASENKNLKQIFEEGKETQDYKKKERIYSAGQRPHRLFFVESGKVKLYKTNDDGKELIIGICQSGEFLGYTALLDDVVYRETAEALEPSEISSISRDAFEQLVNENSAVAAEFTKLLAGNVHQKEEQLLGIAYNSLRKKVAEALIVLHKKYNMGGDAPIAIHISRENLAAIAGTAKESLIRTLGDFKDEGLIALQGSDIIILEEKKLATLAN